MTRRGFLVSSFAGVGVTAACGNGVGSTNDLTIDARVDATLNELYTEYPNTIEIGQKAAGVLVMPVVTEASFWVGGSYGQGALRIGGATVDYYSATSASAGVKFGAQQYAHVLFFMTEAALNEFRRSSGWTVGADVEYVLLDRGEGLSADSNTLNAPVVAAVFGRAGLLVGASLEGAKYTRIIP
ncbi:MAG: YSC84-related protein [Pseudomonadota bacterium]